MYRLPTAHTTDHRIQLLVHERLHGRPYFHQGQIETVPIDEFDTLINILYFRELCPKINIRIDFLE
jgi:hypothetical protein